MSLENFEVIRKLGDGAFSSVFKVSRKSDGQCYALKRVKLASLSIKEKENALNEIRLMASFSHPNIIAYKDSFIDENSNTLCIVMELAEGGDLMKRIVEHKKLGSNFPEFEIWSALVQITTGLKVLHSANIIHRDLKCANIFISKEGTLKLGDLNVSKVNKMGLAYTQTGTPYYASPEVWRDKPYTYSSDIWSLGCVLYEMCCLDPPFRAADMSSLYKKIIRGDYDAIPSFYSDSLGRVIRHLLQVNPLLRPGCDAILAFPAVQCYTHPAPAASASPDLLKTIKFEPSVHNLRSKLPSPNYESRGMSANTKIVQSASNRELVRNTPADISRKLSLHTRESPKAQLGRQVSLENVERKRVEKNLLRVEGELPDIFNFYPAPKRQGMSPERYAKKIEEIVNRKFPDSRPKGMNKVGMMILDTPKPPLKASPLHYQYGRGQKEAYGLPVAVNPVWQV
jgi:NIMA (never in mitosis gene a)-related kinase 1/4/5